MKQLEKRYDTDKAASEMFSSHAEGVQYLVCPPLEAFEALILSGILSIWVLQNLSLHCEATPWSAVLSALFSWLVACFLALNESHV